MTAGAAGAEVPRADWPRFLDEFSRAHEGWLVTVEEHGPGGSRELLREAPLAGITAEDGSVITIITGTRDAQWTHQIASPTRLRLNRTAEGAESGIESESAGGVRTVIRFRSTALPETVDGMLPDL